MEPDEVDNESVGSLASPPPGVLKALQTVDEWNYDAFALSEASNGQPSKYITYYLLNRYGLIQKFNIIPAVLENFLNRIEMGYSRYQCPYHNSVHAALTVQTMHYMLTQVSRSRWTSDMDNLASLFAALIHDYEHMGTTNSFLINSASDRALIYNDRSVNENHHVSAVFVLMKDPDCNILSNLTQAQRNELRKVVIDMVLSTDMALHEQLLEEMKKSLALPVPKVEKPKALAYVLHCCDIVNPATTWSLHQHWLRLFMEECYNQGDKELELGMPLSKLTDKNKTVWSEVQIKFIDSTIEPSFVMLSDVLEFLLNQPKSHVREDIVLPVSKKVTIQKPWLECISENSANWKSLDTSIHAETS